MPASIVPRTEGVRESQPDEVRWFDKAPCKYCKGCPTGAALSQATCVSFRNCKHGPTQNPLLPDFYESR